MTTICTSLRISAVIACGEEPKGRCTSFAPLLIAIASMARCDSEPLPIEPKLYLLGSFLISATSSATLLTPRLAGTASALG